MVIECFGFGNVEDSFFNEQTNATDAGIESHSDTAPAVVCLSRDNGSAVSAVNRKFGFDTTFNRC